MRPNFLFQVLTILLCFFYMHCVTCERSWFMRVENKECAESQLNTMIGPCPQQIVVLFGKLKKGTCRSKGFQNFLRVLQVQAGPCGSILFNVYNRKQKIRHSRIKYLNDSKTNILKQVFKNVRLRSKIQLNK